MTFRAVSIDDVKEYGAPAAIVLSTLREQGSSATVKVLVQYAAIGRLSGLDQRTVRRAMDRLRKAGALKVEPFRASGHMLVRVVRESEGVTRSDVVEQNRLTQVGAEGLAQDSPPLKRLDSVRSLLDALG